MFSDILFGSGYNNGWLAIVYAGFIYASFAILLSSIPSLIFGIPAGLLAKKYNQLNRTVILIGATLIGSLFLSLLVAISIESFDIFGWSMLIGAFGGLFNGYVFFNRLKIQPDAK